MDSSSQLDERDLNPRDDDTVSHVAAIELRLIFRIVVVFAIVATGITMVTFWFWAWIPASFLVLAYVGLILSKRAEIKTRHDQYNRAANALESEKTTQTHFDQSGNPVSRETYIISMHRLKMESIFGVEIIVGLVLAAVGLVVVGVLTGELSGDLIMLSVILIVVYGGLVMAPVWLGWFGDAVEEERIEKAGKSPDIDPPHGDIM